MTQNYNTVTEGGLQLFRLQVNFNHELMDTLIIEIYSFKADRWKEIISRYWPAYNETPDLQQCIIKRPFDPAAVDAKKIEHVRLTFWHERVRIAELSVFQKRAIFKRYIKSKTTFESLVLFDSSCVQGDSGWQRLLASEPTQAINE